MFVDDSGNTRPHRRGSGGASVHVLCGMIVHECSLHNARLAIDNAKRGVFAGSDPDGWELHAYDVWNNRGEFSGAGHGLNLEKKREVFSKAVEAIAASGAALVGVVVWKNRLRGGPDGPRIRAISWGLLAERFEAYLCSRGGDNLGLIISDASNGSNEEGVRIALRAAVAGIGRRKKSARLVMEDVIFKDSRREQLIQGADMSAYVLQKRCHGDPSFSGWFARLEACMWRQSGDACGLKEHPHHQ